MATRAGQHFVVRLTAPDGYQASRSYSVRRPSPASVADGTAEIELTVERFHDGEISTFLHDEVVVGDTLEVRGPIGGWFVWEGDAPALLVGGGSGVVPLMAMLRLARTRRRRRICCARRLGADAGRPLLRRRAPRPRDHGRLHAGRAAGFAALPGRLTAADLEPLVREDATTYVCGSPAFCDGATDLLTALAVPVDRIRVERFGDTG